MPPYTEALKGMDKTQIYNLVCRVLIKTIKSAKLPGSTHPLTLMWPQMLRKPSYHQATNTFPSTKD